MIDPWRRRRISKCEELEKATVRDKLNVSSFIHSETYTELCLA